jgi:NhaP-type Na+/H+ or K+/H+ antiporter
VEYALFGVIAIVTIVTVASFSKKLGIAAPLILVVVGIIYSYLPGVPPIEVEPDWILMGILPPLLYSAAVAVPVVDFRRNFGSITALSVALVLVSAFATGFLLFALLPDLNLAAAIALGAVISPTDVVAATSIGKRLGLPPRLVTILEGEGLVNDATALVMLRSAVAAAAMTATGDFDAWGAVGDFFYAVIVAVALGLIVGVVSVWVRGRLGDTVLDTAISFAVPFIAFIPSEELGASGVIAVVVAGLYSGHAAPARFPAQARISERLNWRTVQFVLENGVFLLMGLQIKGIVTQVESERLSVAGAVLLGLLAAGLLIVLRFLFVAPLIAGLRRREKNAGAFQERAGTMLDRIRGLPEGDARTEKRRRRVTLAIERRTNDVAQLSSEGLGWRGGLVIGWAGMRGVVTLAAAQTLPRSTPYYEQLVLIAFTVAIVTLLLQGATLPFVIRLSGIRGSDRTADRRELATLLDEIEQAGLELLDGSETALSGGEPIDTDVVERVRDETRRTALAAWERADNGTEPEALPQSPHQQYRALRREVLDAQRMALLDARSRGAYPSRILSRAQALLDLEEARLEQNDNGGRLEH